MRKKLIYLVFSIFVLSLICPSAVLGVIVLERRIVASTDDAEEALTPGYTNWNYSSDLELVHDRIDNGGSQLVGMTFRDIDIAPGEVISNAYIEFVCDETINGTADAYFLIWGHLTDNSEGFIEPYLISDRPKTQAQIPWQPDPWNARGEKIQTVNIAPIIQELINQEGWAPGNALEIIIGADPDKPAFTGVRCAESFDGSRPEAPLLHIEIDVPYATAPDPADGDMREDTWVNLMWSPGISAVSHDVYLGDNFDDVYNGDGNTFQGNQIFTFFTAGFIGFAYPDGLVRDTTYYWRIDEIEADGTVVTGDVWSFTIHPLTASNPSPPDGATYAAQDIELSWTAGLGAKIHTVYFGDNYDQVSNASGGSPQSATTYTPGPLAMDKTYYWRVDEFDTINTHKGNVWSFTTHPEMSIVEPHLIGWWTFDEGQGTVAIDSSGYNHHGHFVGDPQWVVGKIGGAIQLDGDDDYVEIGSVGLGDMDLRTVAGWAKANTMDIPAWTSVFGFVPDGDTFGTYYDVEVDGTGHYVIHIGGWDSKLMPVDTQWHHFAFTYTGNGASWYLDGGLVDNAEGSGPTLDHVRIGARPSNSHFFPGLIDDVRIYNVVLSADEIAALAQ
ncbi:MAG: LamG domain-containing protein [Sedimentisphaerales bacterium]|jgi:hypothetical protein